MDYDIKHAEDEADRCAAQNEGGTPCRIQAVEGSKYCPKHGGAREARVADKERVRNYRLRRWQSQLEEKADSSEILSLREEIGISRIMVEEIFAQCEDSAGLLAHQQQLMSLMTILQKTVVACQQVEVKTGNLLSKNQLMAFADEVVSIVSDHIEDQSTLNAIAGRLMNALERTVSTSLEVN